MTPVLYVDFDSLRLKVEDLLTDCCDQWIDYLPNDISLAMRNDEAFEYDIRETMMYFISDEVNIKL